MNIKKILILNALILLFACPAFSEVKLPLASGFVNDFAKVLSAQQKQELELISSVLKQQSGAELAVAVVKTVEPLDSKLYAVKLFEKWRIGEKGKDNGILVLLAMEEKRIEIEVGYGLEGVIPDALAGRILDAYAVPYFKRGEIGEGLVQTAKAIAGVVSGEEIPLAQVTSQKKTAHPSGPYLFYIIIAVIVLGIIFRKAGSVVMGVLGAVWGSEAGGLGGAVAGALIGLFFGFWGIYFFGRGGGGWGGGLGGGGLGGFGGGRSGGGGAGRSW